MPSIFRVIFPRARGMIAREIQISMALKIFLAGIFNKISLFNHQKMTHSALEKILDIFVIQRFMDFPNLFLHNFPFVMDIRGF